MYVVFESALLSWRGGDVNAKLQNPLSLNMAVKWWNEIPPPRLAGTFPTFEFEVKRPTTHPENYWTGADVDLYHQRLIDVIASFGVQYELFPAVIRDRKTKQPTLTDYHVFRLLEVAPIIDYERSKILESTSNRRYRVPVENLPANLPLLCRDTHYGGLVFVHLKVQAAIEDAAIIGCRFLSLDDYVARLNITRTAGG